MLQTGSDPLSDWSSVIKYCDLKRHFPRETPDGFLNRSPLGLVKLAHLVLFWKTDQPALKQSQTYCMQCLDNPPHLHLSLPHASSLAASLFDANAHAFNRKVLKLIHSKPAALRVVYYKRVFAELPPDEACVSTVSPKKTKTKTKTLITIQSGGATCANRHHSFYGNSWPRALHRGSKGSADAYCQFILVQC